MLIYLLSPCFWSDAINVGEIFQMKKKDVVKIIWALNDMMTMVKWHGCLFCVHCWGIGIVLDGTCTIDSRMSRLNMTRYWTQYERKCCKTLLRIWTQKRHPIARPFGRAMGCLLEFFGEKLLQDVVSTLYYTFMEWCCYGHSCYEERQVTHWWVSARKT